MREINIDIQGLNENDVLNSRAKYGINEFEEKRKHFLVKAIGDLLSEPRKWNVQWVDFSPLS